MINIAVSNQTITANSDETLVSRTRGKYKFKAVFDETWSGLTIRIIFIGSGVAKSIEDYTPGTETVIPWEIFETPGKIRVSAVGTKNNLQITTKKSANAELEVYKNGATSGEGTTPQPSPSPGEQALTVAQQAKALAEQAEEIAQGAADSAKWGGITGEIIDQQDISAVFAAYTEAIDGKVSFKPPDPTHPALNKEQRIQARDNIKAAAGGKRRVTQDTSKIIDISSYTSTTNHFECPCDGYLRLRGPASGRVNASVDNYTSISAKDGDYNMTFVAEGAWIFIGAGTPQVAQFLPIELVE